MKIGQIFVVALVFALSVNAYAGETLLQTVSGDKAEPGDRIEVKIEPGASSGKIAAIHADLPQWASVNYMLGQPTPAGKSLIRFRIYVDGRDTAKFMAYILIKGHDYDAGMIQIPADAKAGSFVDVDVPVNSQKEWDGVCVKKAEKADKPGPWIDTISSVLP